MPPLGGMLSQKTQHPQLNTHGVVLLFSEKSSKFYRSIFHAPVAMLCMCRPKKDTKNLKIYSSKMSLLH